MCQFVFLASHGQQIVGGLSKEGTLVIPKKLTVTSLQTNSFDMRRWRWSDEPPTLTSCLYLISPARCFLLVYTLFTPFHSASTFSFSPLPCLDKVSHTFLAVSEISYRQHDRSTLSVLPSDMNEYEWLNSFHYDFVLNCSHKEKNT